MSRNSLYYQIPESVVLTVNDQANLSSKLIRRIKYLIYKLKEKFKDIIYTHIHLGSEGSSVKRFNLKILVGLPGRELVFTCKDDTPDQLVSNFYSKVKRLLSKTLSRSNTK